VTKRKDIPFKSTIIVFILFIFFCAITHIFEIINVWIPLYFITGIVKVITAIISVISTFIILKNLNKILSLPSFKGIETKMFSEMEHIVEKLPVGVIHSDSSGLIKFHNNYINEKFGFSKEELHNQAVEILIPEHKREQHIQYRDSYYKENEIEKKMGEGRILTGKTKDGDSLFLEIGLQPITLEHSRQNITIITIKDVTKETSAKKTT
jgi:PAS domain S-box-containing protein